MEVSHLLFVLVCFAICDIRTSLACSFCPTPKHPQELFCDADFVIKAEIKEVMVIPDDLATPESDPQRKYKVFVEKTFKGNVTDKCNQFIFTPTEDPCGAEFALGDTYLLSGDIEVGDLRTDVCALNIPWEMVTRHQKISLNKRYEENCQCGIGEDKCTVDPAHPFECYQKFTTCVEVAVTDCAPECKWEHRRSFRNCVAK